MSSGQHGGNLHRLARLAGRPAEKILDFSASINPLGFPDWLRPLVSSVIGSVVHYPDPDCSELVAAAADRYGCKSDQLLMGNGSTEILHLLVRVLDKRRAIIMAPSYTDYKITAMALGIPTESFLLLENEDFVPDLSHLESQCCKDDLVLLCNPNNPTGGLLNVESFRQIAENKAGTFFILDEAFADFVDDMDSLTQNRPSNVAVLLSLTKLFAIPGLRLGCAVADAGLADQARRVQPTWSVNTLAQAVGTAALRDCEYVAQTRNYVREQRQVLHDELSSIAGLAVFDGKANFLLCKLVGRLNDANLLANMMIRDGIAIRVCDDFEGLDEHFFRIAVRTADENARLLDSLKRCLGISRNVPTQSRAKALMFQGTSSNAGKSVLTAALGRILLQDGCRVAPFKAQNMSLNSFVTRTGGEMGRAQVVQAQACRLDPDVRMNPVLLKPNSDTGSQVIVLGKPVGNMNVEEYINYKPQVFEAVRTAYDSLATEFDAIVLEGAGSPAEVNLKHHDIVNMRMAQYANARVLLVGDIDRGGVFASFVGTMEVLSEWERNLIAGFVINRFRGEKALLQNAIQYTFNYTNRPVFGVVPYLNDLGLPEEDSVSFKEGLFDDTSRCTDDVQIAVIDLPHISNFTDFDSFRVEPDVRLCVVRDASDLTEPDAVILPGSKNTIGDLIDLNNKGITSRLRNLVAQGTELVGICGGFQMLGRAISDPHRLESDNKVVEGMGFLNVTTGLAQEKTLTRSTGVHIESQLPVTGYEIHHGQSDCTDAIPLVEKSLGGFDGARSFDGRVWGTYLHGIFDQDRFRRWFVDRLRCRKGLVPKGEVCATYDLEQALDRLADIGRSSLDMDKIYRLLGL